MNYPNCQLIDVDQRSPEWFEARKGHLTASQFGNWLTESKPTLRLTIEEIKTELAELGIDFPPKGRKDEYAKLLPHLDSYMDTTQAYKDARLTAASRCLAEFAGYPDPRPYETDDMKRGVEMEESARQLFQKATGLTVDQIGFAKFKYGLCGCSPDGLILDEGSGLEIKMPRASKLIQYIEKGELPPEYTPQVHGSMAITGARKWHFFAWHQSPPSNPEFKFPYFHIVVEWNTYTDSMLEGLKSYSNYIRELSSRMQSIQKYQAQ